MLAADGLEKRGAMALNEQVDESPRGIATAADDNINGFEILEMSDGV